MRLWRQRAASAHVIIEIGKSKRGKKYLQHKKALTERAKRAEFLTATKQISTERAKRAESY
tara:strand:- start:160 stop:342 length:183 start_codon:yes stop_codon:yes gene_type:complete